MIEIDCNICQNLINKTAGCRVYGSEAVKGVKACAADAFINYQPKVQECGKAETPCEVKENS